MKRDRIKNMMRYDNNLNRVNFGSLNTLEQNLLFAVICGMYGKTELMFDIEKLRRFASGSHTPIKKDRVEELLNNLKNTIFQGYITEKIGNEIVTTHLFRTISLVYNNNGELIGLKVIIDELARNIFIRKQGNLTITDYDIFASIRSTYIKSIFRLLSQYKGTGIARFKYDEFLFAISCPDSYRQENIKERILEPSIKVIGDYFKDLKYELIKDYYMGKKQIVGIVFKFKPIQYKSDINEELKKLEMTGEDYQQIKKYKNTLEVLSDLSPSAEQAIISSQIEGKRRRLYRDKGIYQVVERVRKNRFNCVNDISNKLERKADDC